MNNIINLSIVTLLSISSIACSSTKQTRVQSEAPSSAAMQPTVKSAGSQVDFNFDRPTPIVSRPSPRYILIKNADTAFVSPWSPAIEGIPMLDAHLAWGDEIVFWVDPETDYHITARHSGRITVPDPSRPNVFHQGPATTFEYDVPVSYENMLDWNLYNKIRWDNRYNQFEDTYGISSQQLMEAILRVEQMFINDNQSP